MAREPELEASKIAPKRPMLEQGSEPWEQRMAPGQPILPKRQAPLDPCVSIRLFPLLLRCILPRPPAAWITQPHRVITTH